MNKSKMFGEKIEKNIRYNELTDTYYVQFNFSPTGSARLRGFPTLEDARVYRDTINAEKLKYKIEKDTAIIKNKEIKEVKEAIPYPYNVFKAIPYRELKVDNYFIDNFDEILRTVCSEKERRCIEFFFKEDLTLAATGREFGVTRERVRQVIAVAVRKIANYVYSYDSKQKMEREFADRHALREKLIEEYKKNGVITPEIEYEFGKLIIDAHCADKNLTIEDLNLSVRSYNALKRGGIKYVNELTHMKEDDILKIRTMGRKSCKEIRNKLLSFGYDFVQMDE